VRDPYDHDSDSYSEEEDLEKPKKEGFFKRIKHKIHDKLYKNQDHHEKIINEEHQ